jgi:MoxR-like ATPase
MMNKFDGLFKLLEARYEDVAKDFNIDELDDLDISQFDSGDDLMFDKKEEHDLSVYGYKLTELAILEALDTQLKPLMIYGESGIGKSKLVKSVAQNIIAPDRGLKFVEWKEISNDEKKRAIEDPEYLKSHYMFIDIRAAELEPIDLRGIELPTSKTPYLDPKIPLWIYYSAMPESNGVLFFDEMNQAMRQVFNALFGVILDRQAGDMKFSDNWGIIAAGNLGTKHVSTDKLPIALTQRFDTIYLVANPKEWAEWAVERDANGVPRLEPEVVSYALSDVDRTFLVETSEESSQSVANPRNIETFSKRYRLIKHYYANPDRLKGVRWLTGNFFNDVRKEGIKTCGDSWTNGFIQFIRVYSKLNWDDLATNAKKYASQELEQLYAYIYFVAKKTIQTFGYGTPLNKKYSELIQKTLSGEATSEEEWEEGRKFIQQFAAIAAYLIYQAGDISTNGVQNKGGSDQQLAQALEDTLDGDGEHLATLFSMIRASDPARKAFTSKSHPQEAIAILGNLCMKYQALNKDVKTLLIAIKKIQEFGK